MRTLIISVLLLSSLANATGEDGESVEWTPLCVSTDRALILEHRCFSPGISGCTPRWPVVQLDFATMKKKTLPSKPIDQHVAEQKLTCRSYQDTSLLKANPSLSAIATPQGVTLICRHLTFESRVLIPPKQVRGDLSGITCDDTLREGEGCWGLDQVLDAERKGEDGGVDTEGAPWRLPTMRRALVFRRSTNMQELAAVSVEVEVLENAAARALNDLGVQLLRAGNPEPASGLLEQAQWRNPNATYNLACAYARQGLAARAVEVLHRIPLDAALVKKISKDADFNRIRKSAELTAFLYGYDAGH